ncbi:exodeoxyribonuclease V subunit alpha [Lysobacter sp. A378]
MTLFDQLRRSGGLRAIDHALTQSLRRLERGDPSGTITDDSPVATHDWVLSGAALASLAVAHGHAGFDPAQPGLLLDAAIDWPDADDWREVLAASRWVTTPAAQAVAPTHAPLVLDGGLLYLRRYREYERRLALRLQEIAAHTPAAGDMTALAPVFSALFPQAGDGEDRQARAATLALVRSLLLVTGGPGTGKTTTIARLLVLLIAQARLKGTPPLRIALAAPTGRAAERMAESLRAAAGTMRELAAFAPASPDATLLDALPTEASTLHRLLGTVPDSPSFRHGIDNPLPFDVIVVDEASMVDLPLMCKLAEAVPEGARLILLGDPDQLPSVEAGDVLAGIVEAAGAGDGLPSGVTTGLAGHRVQLQRGYRQTGAFELAALADAVRAGAADTALELLRSGSLAGVHFHENLLDPLDRRQSHRDILLSHWRALGDAPDPATALARAGRVRLLTALRDGAQGARGLNERIEEALVGRQRGGYFQGRLLLVTQNSYRHRLFNGDIGICLRDDRGMLVAWFADNGIDRNVASAADGPAPSTRHEGVRAFHPAALPAHESAFAMTVHKAQGSEFDEVWLQLPRQDGRGVSRELVYTALTRARNELHLCASEAVLRGALARHAGRVSGLARRLCQPQSGG